MAATFIFVCTVTVLGAVNFSTAGTITANIDTALCPGEELILNCVGQGTSQRWLVYHVGSSSPYEYSFAKWMTPGTQFTRFPKQYTFTLIAKDYYHFESRFATTARQALHNTRIVCNDAQPTTNFTIKIAGAPTSPLNIYNIVDEYFVNYSTVTVSWDQPSDQSRVDYYLIRYMYQLSNDLTIAFNTTNTSFTQFSVSYNEIMTVSVTSFNCIGKSTPVVYNFDIVGCSELNTTLYSFNDSAFSQAPGTQLMLSCNLETYNNKHVVNTTCQRDGTWEPDPKSQLCQSDPITVYTSASTLLLNVDSATTSRSNTTTVHVHATATLSNNSNTILLPVYIFAATLATCLCTIVGIIIVTICALKQARRRRDLRMLPVPLYDEITDPIYATVPAALNEDKSKPSVENVDTQIELSRNDACKQDLSQNVHTAQPHSIGVTLLTDNTAYNIPGNSTDSTVLTWNDSYHFAMSMRSDNKSANTSDIPEGDAN